jgi:outer membrane lipoprotein carrier protein
MAQLLIATLLLFQAPEPAKPLSRLVDDLQKKYDNLKSLSTDFVQVYTSGSERSRRETGRLLLKKPGKMRWDYSSPEAKVFVSDGKVIYEYVPSERLATRTPVKESDDLRAPFMFLLGRGNLRRDFKRIELGVEAPAKAGNHVLRLVPNRNGNFRELLVEVDPDSLIIARLSIIESGGSRSDFIFSNMQENVHLADDRFTFKPPAGVRVVVD